MCLFLFLLFLLKLCVHEKLSTFAKLENASSTAWLLMYSRQNKVTNVGALLRFQKSKKTLTSSETAESFALRYFEAESSEPKIRTNLCFEVLYRASISVILFSSRIQYMSFSRTELGSARSHLKVRQTRFFPLPRQHDFP